MKKVSWVVSKRNWLFRFVFAFVCLFLFSVTAKDFGKIMPMGDSITLGVPIDGGYRDPLARLLEERGDTFQYVEHQDGYQTEYLQSINQIMHEGCSGFVITNGGGLARLYERLDLSF